MQHKHSEQNKNENLDGGKLLKAVIIIITTILIIQILVVKWKFIMSLF